MTTNSTFTTDDYILFHAGCTRMLHDAQRELDCGVTERERATLLERIVHIEHASEQLRRIVSASLDTAEGVA
jgi:hypothetical protein